MRPFARTLRAVDYRNSPQYVSTHSVAASVILPEATSECGILFFAFCEVRRCLREHHTWRPVAVGRRHIC